MKKILLALGLTTLSLGLTGCNDNEKESQVKYSEDQLLKFSMYSLSNIVTTEEVTSLSLLNNVRGTDFETKVEELQPYYEMLEEFSGRAESELGGITKDEESTLGYDIVYTFKVGELTYTAAFNYLDVEIEEGYNVEGKLFVGDLELDLHGRFGQTENGYGFKLKATDELGNEAKFSLAESDAGIMYRYHTRVNGVSNVAHIRVTNINGKQRFTVMLGENHKTADVFTFMEKTTEDGYKITKMSYRIDGKTGAVIIRENIETGEITYKIAEKGKLPKELKGHAKHRLENKFKGHKN